MNNRVKVVIQWWMLKGQREHDPFIKFFFFYMCFDAWLTAESGEDSDIGKIEWLVNTDNCLKNCSTGFWESAKVKGILNGLKNLSPIEDMRPGHRGKFTTLSDIADLERVIKFIYQIRCNFFHGSKNPMNSRDSSVVELAGDLLEKWIVWASLKCLNDSGVG